MRSVNSIFISICNVIFFYLAARVPHSTPSFLSTSPSYLPASSFVPPLSPAPHIYSPSIQNVKFVHIFFFFWNLTSFKLLSDWHLGSNPSLILLGVRLGNFSWPRALLALTTRYSRQGEEPGHLLGLSLHRPHPCCGSSPHLPSLSCFWDLPGYPMPWVPGVLPLPPVPPLHEYCWYSLLGNFTISPLAPLCSHSLII